MEKRPKTIKSSVGYTLIELLIVIGLIGLTVGVTGDIILSLVRSYAKTQATNELERSTNFVVSKIEKEFKNATAVTTLSGNTISFTTKLLDSTTPMTVSYSVASCHVNGGPNVNCLRRSVNAGSSVDVTDADSIKLTCIGTCFNDANLGGIPRALKLSMKFEKNNGASTSSAFTGEVIINTTVVAKGTY